MAKNIFIELLIILICIEIVPLIFGIVWNWLMIPKNSTIKDLIGDFNNWQTSNSFVIPLFMFIIPGINIILVILMILLIILNIFDNILDQTNIKKWIKNIKSKIINIRIK